MFNEVISVENEVTKPKHKIVENLGFVEILNILELPKEVVRLVLNRVHGEFIWLE